MLCVLCFFPCFICFYLLCIIVSLCFLLLVSSLSLVSAHGLSLLALFCFWNVRQSMAKNFSLFFVKIWAIFAHTFESEKAISNTAKRAFKCTLKCTNRCTSRCIPKSLNIPTWIGSSYKSFLHCLSFNKQKKMIALEEGRMLAKKTLRFKFSWKGVRSVSKQTCDPTQCWIVLWEFVTSKTKIETHRRSHLQHNMMLSKKFGIQKNVTWCCKVNVFERPCATWLRMWAKN